MPNDDAILTTLRDHHTAAAEAWAPVLEEARKDRLCRGGKVWEALDSVGLAYRIKMKRPHLSFDELGQYLNQVVNEVRANPRGIKFAPTGNGANDQGAEFYANHMREIEYRSHASRVAYPTAFDHAVTSGYGWIRIRTKRAHLRTFDQDIWIDPVMNPDQVLPDPAACWPDSRDMRYLFFEDTVPEEEFTRQYPDAAITDFKDYASTAPEWLHDGLVRVAEYWEKQITRRTLVAFRLTADAAIQTALLDELPGQTLPAGADNVREEQVDDATVHGYLTNGVEILKELKWVGKHIPFVSCFGAMLYVEHGGTTARELLSLTRLARDPAMHHAYMSTCEAESVGGIPRAQWVGYKGQFTNPAEWAKANHEPVAYLEVEPMVEGAPGGTVLPLPQKQAWDPPIQSLEIAKESARRSIQAAMGISPLPTAAQRQTEKSGKALQVIKSAGQQGSFHFVDHFDLMLEWGAAIVEDLIDKVIDTARDVAVRKPDDSTAMVRVNDPSDPQAVFTKGDYRVTISTGPASDSQREVASDFVDSMVSNLGAIAQMAGPQKALALLAKSIKMKQLGPVGDEIVELLEPPAPKGQDGKPLPPEVAQLQAENQQLQQQLQQAVQAIQSKQVEKQAELQAQGQLKQMEFQAQGQMKRMELDAVADKELALQVMKNAATIAVAHIAASAKGASLAAHAQEEAQALGQAALEGVKDRQHDVNLAQMGHRQALEQGQAGVEGQMMAEEQAATLQPSEDGL